MNDLIAFEVFIGLLILFLSMIHFVVFRASNDESGEIRRPTLFQITRHGLLGFGLMAFLSVIYHILILKGLIEITKVAFLSTCLTIFCMVVFNLMFSIYKDQCGPSIKHLFYLKIVYTFLLMIAAVLNAYMWQVSLVPIISSIGGVLYISLIASLDAIKPIICRVYILLTKNVKNLQFVTLEQSKFCRIQDIGICYSKLLLDSGKVKVISTRKLVKNTIYKISGNQEVIKKNIEFKFPTNDISDHQYETIKQEILYQLKADFNLNQSQVVFRLSREDFSRRRFFVYVETRFNSQSMKKNQFLDIFFSHELYVSKLRKAIFSIILKHYRYPLTQQRLEKYQ